MVTIVRIHPDLGLDVVVDLVDIAPIAHIRPRGADTNNITGCADAGSGSGTQGNVGTARCVVNECNIAHSGVAVAGSVGKKRTRTDGRVSGAVGVVKKRLNTVGHIYVAVDILIECSITSGGVAVPFAVVIER